MRAAFLRTLGYACLCLCLRIIGTLRASPSADNNVYLTAKGVNAERRWAVRRTLSAQR